MTHCRNVSLAVLWLGVATQTMSAQPVFHVLHRFAGGAGGSAPAAAPIEVSPGLFFGAATSVYGLTPKGGFSVFSGQPVTGALFPASNGFLYGGATDGDNEIYQINRDGAVESINNSFFGVTPQFDEGRNRNLYGLGEIGSNGILVNGFFQMSLNGTVVSTQPIASNGLSPQGGPVEGTDGNFYGAVIPGEDFEASFYSVTPPDAPAVLIYAVPDPIDGDHPSGSLVQVGDAFYGVNLSGATGSGDGRDSGYGNIFALTPTGQYTVLHNFAGGSAGQNPSGGLFYASDGYLYGTTSGTDLGAPEVFRIKPDGSSYSPVYQFAKGTKSSPFTEGLVQGTDGLIYGTISPCALYANGAVFSLDLGLTPPLPAVRYVAPSSAAVGTKVLIRGEHLLGVNAVSFNGVPATQITDIGPYFEQAVVPAGATSGPITVSTPNGSATSRAVFTVE